MNDRIGSIDGWRAIAALGVLFGHVLGGLNHPVFNIAGVDLFKLTQVWGHGVQLFFVISGLCFFLVLDKKKDFSFKGTLSFWKKRWLRIAPAFYVSCVIYAIFYSHIGISFYKAILYNFLFIQTYINGAEISPHFWSLSVEWFFYLSLPLLFYFFRKFNIMKGVVCILLIGFLMNTIHYRYNLFFNENWIYTFFANFEHFGWGLLIGYLYKYKKAKKFFSSYWVFFTGLILAYVGKLFFYSSFVNAVGQAEFLFNSLGPLVMSMGFATMLLVSMNNEFIARIIGNKLFRFIGRISYSFYLWHVLAVVFAIKFFSGFFENQTLSVIVIFIITVIILIPVSYLSYRLFESFYFNKKQLSA